MKFRCSILPVLVLTVFVTTTSFAADLGFRYTNGKCLNAQGKDGLNTSYFGQCSDLRGAILGRLNFDSVDFSGSQFTGANLQATSLSNAILVGVNFDGANLSGVKMDNAEIHNSSFKNTVLKNISFSGAQITDSNFSAADFRNSALSFSQISKCILKNAILSGVYLDKAFLRENDFTGAKLDSANLSKSNLTNSILNLVDFTGANLSGANLSGASLSETRMKNANLTGADLTSANIKNVDFSNARLNSVIFANVKMADISFVGASLTGSNLSGLNCTKINFERAELKSVNLSSASCRSTNFKGALLNSANLTKADLTGADLRGSDLTGAEVQDTIFENANFNRRTLLPFSKEKALELKMIFENLLPVLVLWDTKTDSLNKFVAYLNNDGVEVNLHNVVNYQFDGKTPLTEFSAVINFNGTTAGSDMNMEGQKAIVQYVNDGGTFIYSEWSQYLVKNGSYKALKDLMLFQDSNPETNRGIVLNPTEVGKTHPILAGLTFPLSLPVSGHNQSAIIKFTTNPADVIAVDSKNMDAIAVRNVGKGRVVGFTFTNSYNSGTGLSDPNVQKIFSNAIHWAK